jgi:hypothetical protein
MCYSISRSGKGGAAMTFDEARASGEICVRVVKGRMKGNKVLAIMRPNSSYVILEFPKSYNDMGMQSKIWDNPAKTGWFSLSQLDILAAK